MEHLTIDQRVKIIKSYYKNSDSAVSTFRALRADYGRHNRPTKQTILNTVNKFEQTGSVTDIVRSVHHRNIRNAENIASVAESVEEDPNLSIPRRAQHLGLSYGSLWRILHLDLHLHPYKVHLTQELKPADHGQRRTYANWVLEKQAVDADFSNKIFFSDEAHFSLGGYVNKQNCRIWGSENPQLIVEKPLHPEKVTVWCALWSGGVIGPYFFENNHGRTVTVNSERYGRMLTDYFFTKIEDYDLDDMWFQQDGATSHVTRANRDLLQEKFPGRLISRLADVNWPPRSCDLTPLDFFLWGYAKDRVYANNPQTLDELKTNIRNVMAEIPPEMCRKVIENYLKRIKACKKSRGGHLNDILFN